MGYVKQAEAYIQIAEEMLAKGSEENGALEAAVDNYEKAGNMYKLAKNNLRAGELYEKCATLYLSRDKPRLSLDFYSSAISVYKEDHLQLAITTAKQLATVAMQVGCYSQAGKILLDLASLSEDKEDYEEAYALYTKAETAFKHDCASANEHRNCRIRLAELGACLGKSYEVSASIFEDIAIECIQSPALQESAKHFFFSSFVCMALFQEERQLRDALTRFEKHDPSLVGSPEGEFIYECLISLKNSDPTAYETAVTKLRNRMGITLTTNTFKCKILALLGANLGCDTIGELL